MIFQHGLTLQANSYSVLNVEFASHGYVVFAVNSMGGCSAYVQGKDGSDVHYDWKQPFDISQVGEKEWAARWKQLSRRVNDIAALVQELHDRSNYLQEELGFPPEVTLDLDKLVVNGHSFGGITSLLCAQDERFKASLSLDPWFLN